MTRRRILFVAHDTERSGAPRVTLELARGLAERGWRVTLCFPGRGGLEEAARRAGLTTVVVDNPPASLAAANGLARLRIAAARAMALGRFAVLARRADAVWVGSSVAVIAGLGAWLARRPVIYHVHEDLTPTRGNRLRAWLIRRTAQTVVFVARKSRVFFGRRPVGQRWVLLPNFVDGAAIQAVSRAEAAHVRGSLGAGEGNVVFLTAAFLTPRKGIDVLLRAFADVAPARPGALLWIAGGEVAAHTEYAAGLRRFVETHGLRDRVRFLGHREDVAVLLHAADVFVLASRNEALPLTIAEAMMAARPVVATDVGSVADMVEDGKTGALVPAEDAGELAAKMLDFEGDKGLRESAGRLGRQRALRLYDREALLDRAEELVHGITGARD
ncbi:MAG: hypothetical protein PWP23_3179 [Candidatus Sumerlaeota bacterium]|nr:hypothetical protein [Candidatus Sumerlaeota bacterium]